jgi:hypothetical protein
VYVYLLSVVVALYSVFWSPVCMVETRVIYTGVWVFDLRIEFTWTGVVGCHIWRRGHWFHVNVSFQWGFCDPLDIILVLNICLDVCRRKGFTFRVS